MAWYLESYRKIFSTVNLKRAKIPTKWVFVNYLKIWVIRIENIDSTDSTNDSL